MDEGAMALLARAQALTAAANEASSANESEELQAMIAKVNCFYIT